MTNRRPTPTFERVLKLRAHAMRKDPTVEARLWAELSARKLGVSFRRQVPIGRFIVDFCAPAVRLVVEVDGVPPAAGSGRCSAG